MFNSMAQWGASEADGVDSVMSQNSGSCGGVWRASSPAPQQRAGGTTSCQVEGCAADLSLEEKAYCLKKRICSYHMRAEVIMRPGDNQQLWRFCFQCGKLEPLSQFDGPKRSCRARLERRKLPPRRSQTWSAGLGAARMASANSTALAAHHQQQQHQQSSCTQEQIMMLEMQRQQLLMEQQQAQMLLLQQQQHMQHMHVPLPAASSLSAPVTCDSGDFGAAAAAAAASPEALALLQQQHQLLEQKLKLQSLKAAMAQMGLQVSSALSPNVTHGAHTPTSMAGGCGGAPGYGDAFSSAANSSPTGSFNGLCQPAHSAGVQCAAAAGGAAAAGMLQMPPPGGLAAAGPAGQQLQQQASAAAPTAAAAAAALAGSCGWPFNASDAVGNAAALQTVSAPGPAPAGPRVKRAATMAHLGRRPPLSDIPDFLADIEMCDEVDPLVDASVGGCYKSVEEALEEEFAAAFPGAFCGLDAIEADLAGALQQHQQHHHHHQQQHQQQQSLAAAMQAGALGGAPQAAAGMPGSALLHNGLNGLSSAGPSGSAGQGCGGSAGASPAGLQPGASPDLHQMQLQQLMQSVQFLHESVRELTVRMQGGGASAVTAGGAAQSAMAAASGSFGAYPPGV